MFGENRINGIEKVKIDSKNRIRLPKFTGAEKGEELIVLKYVNELLLLNKHDYNLIINYFFNLSKTSATMEERAKYRMIVRVLCANSYDGIKCDKNYMITLPIRFETDEVALKGVSKHLVLKPAKREV